MLETRGNLWDHPIQMKVITTNGKGIVRQANDRYPNLSLELGLRTWACGNHVHYFYDYDIVTFPVKHDCREAADLNLILRSCLELNFMFLEFHLPDVIMVRPGCGNGQLDWSTVRPLILPLLDDRVTIIQE